MKKTEHHYDILKSNYVDYLEMAQNGIVKDFGGPSLYFHQRSLDEQKKSFLQDTHLEMIYATLASWGMHRMGETKTKMVNFSDFKKSILAKQKDLESLRNQRLENVSKESVKELIVKLNEICFDLKVSVSNSRIVGNTKTLAHILPNIIPPIDRQYTIRFFKCQDLTKTVGDFKNDEESSYFNFIMEKAHDFITHINNDERVIIDNEFNTSYPKIFDNLIVAYIKTGIKESKMK